MLIYYQRFINRLDLVHNRHMLFVFGDNTIRQGLGGQAKEMRNEPNSHGIATLWRPGVYFEDKDYNEIIQIIGRDLDLFEQKSKSFEGIIMPMSGIGTGLAYMNLHAPNCFDFMSSQLLSRFNITNGKANTTERYYLNENLR